MTWVSIAVAAFVAVPCAIAWVAFAVWFVVPMFAKWLDEREETL